ncbi:outer membrane protein assembly factor BamB family protein [Bacteriovorax sp. BSW11_IV]|uniref:outer membrane protein assembly factor BamB family protein n=1 Tax=Bacteriovorax sp. BSW11_IV TaxID=1353529 RepID=UPI000553F86F|nr:PQQ-binding-like beta-propeller repeat protein [Bacteriovorax sp. BSW11_IV]
MEELSLNSDVIYYGIIPTVLIPLTLVSFVLSMIASFIAGLFGIKLSTEGPRKLVELVLKPRFIAMAVVINLGVFGVVKAYEFVDRIPTSFLRIKLMNNESPSEIEYKDASVSDFKFKRNLNASFSDYKVQKEVKFDSGAFYSPVVSGDSLFMGSDAGDFMELDKKTLERKRVLHLKTFLSSGTSIHDGFAYFGEGEHKTYMARIFKIDLKNFSVKDYFKTKGHTEGTGARLGESLIFPAGDDGIYRIDLHTMKKMWHAKIGHVDSEVSYDGINAYVGTALDSKRGGEYANAFALDLKTGEIIWKKNLIASSWFRPLVLDEKVCFVVGEIYFESQIGGIECFNKANGDLVGSLRLSAPVTSMMILVDSNIVFANNSGEICSVDSVTLQKNWCTKTGDDKYSYSSVNYDGNKDALVLASRKHGFFAIDPDDGKVLQQVKFGEKEKFYARPLVDEQNLYVVSLDGMVRILN